MKYYELFLHWKQGDDFRVHVHESEITSAAFLAWAQDFDERAAICRRIAAVLDGKNVYVDADTHHIGLYSPDAEAEAALEALKQEGVIRRLPLDEVEDEEDAPLDEVEPVDEGEPFDD